MKKSNFLDTSVVTDGDQIINQQLIESYHSGVIDHDVEARKREIETEA
ncbi:hypothetical protein NC661_02605 [Aquibacillus koreensis]|uniref:Uncharacterized protein n=1 Tax=Aquibacillus koreensis TaxID=279446 RepID=A0A9X3WL34_9BACI|nr:hypothetical protein [Aquibacillus koreensis]MCT2534982.1 hypothetical protein [Aquibacillus koreensis]MDC3419269.1 hypothetical protein [Aquibacillus koreensis]